MSGMYKLRCLIIDGAITALALPGWSVLAQV